MYNKPVIFCVDDEIIIALGILRGIERHFGSTFCYEVTFDPTDGLRKLAELKEVGAPVLLILSDWTMPKMTGAEFLAQARQIYPTVHTALVTAHPDVWVNDQLTECNDLCEVVFAKPIELPALIKHIESLVTNSK